MSFLRDIASHVKRVDACLDPLVTDHAAERVPMEFPKAELLLLGNPDCECSAEWEYPDVLSECLEMLSADLPNIKYLVLHVDVPGISNTELAGEIMGYWPSIERVYGLWGWLGEEDRLQMHVEQRHFTPQGLANTKGSNVFYSQPIFDISSLACRYASGEGLQVITALQLPAIQKLALCFGEWSPSEGELLELFRGAMPDLREIRYVREVQPTGAGAVTPDAFSNRVLLQMAKGCPKLGLIGLTLTNHSALTDTGLVKALKRWKNLHHFFLSGATQLTGSFLAHYVKTSTKKTSKPCFSIRRVVNGTPDLGLPPLDERAIEAFRALGSTRYPAEILFRGENEQA